MIEIGNGGSSRTCASWLGKLCFGGGLAAVAGLLLAGAVPAATIQGVLKDERGQPVRRAQVCLWDKPDAVTTGLCFKQRNSGRRGKYVLPGIRKGVYYAAALRPGSAADSAAWLPELRKVVIERKNQVRKNIDFTLVTQAGADGFRNFRNDLSLTAEQFPELTTFLAGGETTVLKVYLPSAEEGSEAVLFLGQITDPGALSIPLSLPRDTAVVAYEVFTTSRSASGQLKLPPEP